MSADANEPIKLVKDVRRCQRSLLQAKNKICRGKSVMKVAQNWKVSNRLG